MLHDLSCDNEPSRSLDRSFNFRRQGAVTIMFYLQDILPCRLHFLLVRRLIVNSFFMTFVLTTQNFDFASLPRTAVTTTGVLNELYAAS
jgi:hypothetical protein